MMQDSKERRNNRRMVCGDELESESFALARRLASCRFSYRS
jgi:hypothetical protein